MNIHKNARTAGLILLRAIADTGMAIEDWFTRVERSLIPECIDQYPCAQ